MSEKKFTSADVPYEDVFTQEELTNHIFVMKVFPEHFEETLVGNKLFEVREYEGEQEGDLLFLREWDGKGYTGNWIKCRVTYIWYDGEHEQFGMERDFCVIGFVIL